VVGQRRLGEAELEHAARRLVSVDKTADDLESGGIAQGVKDAGEFQLFT
jgi:hypothetical protein